MAKNWEQIFDIFTSLFSRDLSKEFPDAGSLSGAGIGQADSVGSAEYLEGGSTFNHAVEVTNLNDFLEIGEHTDRRARYLEYDRLENVPEISSALDSYADEITVPDIDQKIYKIHSPNQAVKEECEWLFDDLLDLSTETIWSWVRNLCKNGDIFLELIMNTNHPNLGIQKIMELPPETMYRIETVRGKVLEFQQSYQGPDYQAVISDLEQKNQSAQKVIDQTGNAPFMSSTGALSTSQSVTNKLANTVIRFTQEQIVHVKIGMKRRGFYPYGISILYAGRRIAHLLKLVEDAMIIYRLSRSPERRVFYIDIGTLQPHKGEQALERIKDKIKKKKIYNNATGQIDERYNAWAIDEDFFLPVRPGSTTRIETLPGAQNLDQIGDVKYFRDKLMIALKLPKNYLLQEDAALSRSSIAVQDIRFARTVYRIQKIMASALRQIAIRHLMLKGYTLEDARTVKVSFTSPSDWIELSRSEILSARYNLAGSIKSSSIYDDFTILTKILQHTDEEATTIMARMEKQILRQQELQAQAQIFAQLNTPDSTEQKQFSPQDQSYDQFREPMALPQAQQSDQTQQADQSQPMSLPEIDKDDEFKEKKEKSSKKLDISDLEADEEELDFEY